MPKAIPSDSPPKSLPSSTFSFTAPFPSSSTTRAAALKQRRVSLALPSSPRQVPAWTFRDDTDIESGRASERRGKMRKLASGESSRADDSLPQLVTEKKARKKWTMEETQMLVEGCNRHGVGNWKSILNDPTLEFDHRSPVDLKDRFRTYFPDAYKQHYPNAKTHLSSKIRSAHPDGSSIFAKTRSKKRRPFTEAEDRALKAGYDKHGTVWATIVKDPIFQEQGRRSTDLRDRFRNAFPDLYKAAGYKPRTSAKKKVAGGHPQPMRAATDEQLNTRGETGPARRKRRHTTQGLLRGGTKSVPQSASCTEDEETSADEDDEDVAIRPFLGGAAAAAPSEAAASPQLVENMPPPTMTTLEEVDMNPIDDALADPLAIPEFMPSSALSEMTDSSQSQTWSAVDTPMHSSAAWSSTNAGSPTSSHDLLFDSPFLRRPAGSGGLGPMIGKSAWGPSDWLSNNPRLDPSGASSSTSPSYFDGVSPSPSSPYSFAHLSHGVLDRYDLLFPTALPTDFASEAGFGDSHSTFSDPDVFSAPSAFRGFTHHSNYAGDLIFGARSHQPQAQMSQSDYGPGFGFGAGLGLSGMGMQMHTPALPGIDEIELAAINLNDDDAMDMDGAVGTVASAIDVTKAEEFAASVTQSSPSDLDLDLASDALHGDTPPDTPLHTASARPRSHHHHVHHAHTAHNRSLSVPPPEHRFAFVPPPEQQHTHAPLTPTRSLSLDLDACAAGLTPDSAACALHALLQGDADPWRSAVSGDVHDLPFLDLHYYGGGGAAGGLSGNADELRQGLALDLAHHQHPHPHQPGMGSVAPRALTLPQYVPKQEVGVGASIAPGKLHLHHRGQSAVSPQDLLLRKGGDNKRKRASWDGGPR